MRTYPTLEEYKTKYLGKKFNNLTITDIYKVPKYGYQYTYCHCICDCGNEIDTTLTRVVNGITKSCGCIRQQTIQKAIEWCRTNYVRKQNKVRRISPGLIEVIPTGSNPNNITFFVDECTWIYFDKYPWYADAAGYMSADIAQTHVRYHHLLLSSPPNYVIDHKNRNKQINMYFNLRAITQSFNVRNRGANCKSKSGYKGIIQTGPSTWYVQTNIPYSNGKRRTKVVHNLQEAILLQKSWEDEFFANAEFDAPKLILPDGKLNPYFRFDWFHPRYIPVWKELGFLK